VNLPPTTLDGPAAALPSDKTDLIAPAQVAEKLGQAGVRSTAKIVVYGAGVDANAGRIFWDLEYLGATDVHVLDGGFEKWKKDAYAVSTEKPDRLPAEFKVTIDSARLATKPFVLANHASPSYAFIDSRNATDFVVKHVPGSVNILTGEYLNGDGTVKTSAELRALLDGKGVTADKKVITSCYIGYRSAQAYFMFRLMGQQVANYDGSWTEWNADAATPKEP
jgi:thiosulfate/3-mercaptopyruvate sulfurtransferase